MTIVVLTLGLALLATRQRVEEQGSNGAAPYLLVENWPEPPPAQHGGFGNMPGVTFDTKGLVSFARPCPVKCGYRTDGAASLMGGIQRFSRAR